MGARNLFWLETSSDLFDGRRNILSVVCSFWVLLCNLGRYIFRRIRRERDGVPEEITKSLHFYETQQEIDDEMFGNCEEEDHRSWNGNGEGFGSVLVEPSFSMYQFSFGSNISGIFQEPKPLSFTVQEMFARSPTDSADLSGLDSSDDAAIICEKVGNLAEEKELLNHPSEEEAEVRSNHTITKKAAASSPEDGLPVEKEGPGEVRANWETSSRSIELELESIDSNDDEFDVYKVGRFPNEAVIEAADHKVDISGSFWDFDDGVLEEVGEKSDSEESYSWDEDLANPGVGCSIEDHLQDQSGDCQDQSSASSYDEYDYDDDDEYIEMEMRSEGFLVRNDRGIEEDHTRTESGHGERFDEEYDNEEDEDSMWEHDEILEKLKLELKAAKTGGLPTIQEEPESEKESASPPPLMIPDDLMKPLKIADKKPEHKDRIMEIQKVYKSYAERMRKFDILNYQTMHAIGIVHLTDPLRSNAVQMPSAPMIKSMLSQNLLPVKLRKNKIGPAAKSMEAYYGDLEMVYVGQVCLSWEILQWQYGKSRNLLESDPYGTRQYNVVAGEFQLFQVLLRRFIENEPFQGPRIENYVKNRCVVRSLLQVPALRDDSFGDKKARLEAKDAVPYAALMEIIEETIRLFWEFVHSDKEEGDAIHKACKKTQFNHLDAEGLELLIITRNHLHKKEKKLKDIVRSGNCIVKRFQKHRNQSDQMLLMVLAQAEMRLVSRVLNMAKVTRDQVLWCQEKLDRINFVSRKIYVEPSFLLFPS